MPREIDSLNATCRHHNVVRIGFSLGAFGLAKSPLYPFGLDVGRSRAGPGDTDRTELLITVATLGPLTLKVRSSESALIHDER